jgi:hypothetical protein
MTATVINLNDVAPAHAQPVRYDLDLIVQRLRETAETWVPRFFPNGKRVGNEWRLANIRGDAPRNTGSCVIALRGPHAGDWIDFDGNEGGGPISTLEAGTGLTGRDLVVEAADMTGVTAGAPARQAPVVTATPKRDAGQEIEHILSGAAPIDGSPVETYLDARGLTLPAESDLLFHHDLTHWETKTGYAAMVGQVRDRSGEVIGLHRTYLVTNGNEVRKAPIAKPKMMLGRIAGGAVRLAPIGKVGRVALCEGIETGLAVMTVCPDLPVWATLSTSGLEQVDLPPAAQRVLILADHDVSGAGLRAAEASARRLRAQGRDVAIAMPPEDGEDFNDMLLRAGSVAVASLVEATEQDVDADAVLQTGQHRPLNYQGSGNNIPVLRADEGDLGRAVGQVWSVVMASNRTPWVFRFAGQPTWVVPDDEGRPVATILNEERLRHMLARLARWVRETAKGELLPAPPPVATVKSVLATPDPALPVLTGIVNTPVFGRTGTLITEPGYHPDARLLYVPAPGFKVPDIPKRPTESDIAAARELICDDLFGDFPFTGEAERAHVVALLLLGFLRGMIDGPTPLHLIEKPTPGTGATLMVDAVATILTGTGASVMTEGRDDEEWRKRVTAKLRQIPSIILIDNLRAKLDSSAVAAALTAPFWEDRVLGASEMTRLPIRCLWIATGNNPEFSNEMARRLVRIRLDANVEQPWQRKGFRHPDLMVWIRANRARLVAACLTLCQAWIAAGKPRGRKTIGSYENWAQVIGGVLEVARIPGFLDNLEDMMAASDSEGAGWSNFISAWWDRFGTGSVLTSDLFDVAAFCDPAPPIHGATERAQKIAFGKAISRMRDRVFRIGSIHVRVRKAGIEHKAARWKLELYESKPHQDMISQPKVGECQGAEGNVETQHSPRQAIDNISQRECGVCGECFSALSHPRMRARAHDRDGQGKHSQHTQHSQSVEKSDGYEGECSGECPNSPSQHSPKPDWLKELDP